MHYIIRFMLLGVCAACGLALAIAFAFHLEPTEATAGVARYEADDDASASPSRDSASAPATTAPAPVAPQAATYHPLIANQVDQLERTLAQVQQESENTRWFMDRAMSLMNFQRQVAAEASAPQPAAAASTAASPPPAGAESLPLASSPPANIAQGEGDDSLVINVQNRDIREVLDLLGQQGGLNILPSKSVGGPITASLSGVNLETALDVILKSNGYIARREGDFIYVGTPEDFKQIDNASGTIVTRVYRPNYVSSAELQTLIQPMLTPTVGVATVSSPAGKDIPASTDATGGDAFAGGDVLLVRDYETVLAQVDQIVLEVDQRPQQVAIEAMILSVKLDDNHELGVNFEALRDKENVRLISGSGMDSLGTIDVTQGGLKFGFLDSSLGAFVSALESVGDTNVVASPRLMCLNKQRAEILIGSQLGYVSTTVTENAATQAIEFLEVGTQLRLRPFISRDGMVRLEIHPELSTGNVRVEEGFTLPDKEVTQVTTNIMCPDGCTVIIGGLIREDLSMSTSQLPLLGNVPLVGTLFRHRTETMDRREIVVLLTPRIVVEPVICAEGAQAACEFGQRRDAVVEQMSHTSKRHYGKRYRAMAETAWHEGNMKAACRYIDLSLHFDPNNLDTVRLRSQMYGGRAVTDATIVQTIEDPADG